MRALSLIINTIGKKKRREYHEDADDYNELWCEYSSLMKAAANGLMDRVVHEVEAKKVDVNEARGWNKVTALMLAAQSNQVEVAKYLLDAGALVDLRNDMDNTALMLAASAGHLEMVTLLAEMGSNIGLSNCYQHTALILAAAKGHLEIVQWLAEFKTDKYVLENQLQVKNKYFKCALTVAAEFGRESVVRWLVGAKALGSSVNVCTEKGISPLMFACSGKTVEHERIVDILLKHSAKVNVESKEQDTALMWAALGGNISVVEKLLKAGARINVRNKKGMTALMMAAERGHEAVVGCLISYSRSNGYDLNEPGLQDSQMKAMKLAWLHGHVDIATKYFMIPWDAQYHVLSRPITAVFDEEELEKIAKRYANPESFHSLKALVTLAATYNFHFDLFIKLIPRFKTPNSVLNKQMIIFYRTMYLQRHTHDVEIVHKLVQLSEAFAKAANNHPLEKLDLQERIDAIERMLTECLNSDCMDNERNVQTILCASIHKNSKHVYVDDLVEKAQAFLKGPLEASINANITALFSTGHVSTYVDNIFWGFLRQKHGVIERIVCFAPDYLLHKRIRAMFSKESQQIRKYHSVFIHFRFSPAAMFFGEGISKLLFLILVTYVSLYVRARNQNQDWIPDYQFKTSVPELMLMIHACSMVLYEYGQLCDGTTTLLPQLSNIVEYIFDVWNILDDCGLFLVFVYGVLTYTGNDQNSADAAITALSMSTIFFSIGSMRYFSVIEAVGKLIIMVFAMISELGPFAIVFVVFVYGFCIALYCLQEPAPAFRTYTQTILTLFSSTVQNYDSTFQDMSAGRFYALGIIIEVTFILLTSVVLINLIIARMSAIHDEIDNKSFQEWQFTRALTVKQFMLVEEKSPFCMLPPPLNYFPVLVAPFHIWHLYRASEDVEPLKTEALEAMLQKVNITNLAIRSEPKPSKLRGRKLHPTEPVLTQTKKHGNSWLESKQKSSIISIAGTVSDITIGVVMSFIAPVIELVLYVIALSPRVYSAIINDSLSEVLRSGILEMAFIFILFPVIYVCYVLALLMQVLIFSQNTRVICQPGDGGTQFVVEYAKKKKYETPEILPTDVDFITIKVVRGEKLINCKLDSNPVVKFRIGNMELSTNASLYGGENPQWSKAFLVFPLRGVDLSVDQVEYEVVERDCFTGEETMISTCDEPADLQKWVANRSFEGRLKLNNNGGAISVTVKVDFPSFMCKIPDEDVPAAKKFGLYKPSLSDTKILSQGTLLGAEKKPESKSPTVRQALQMEKEFDGAGGRDHLFSKEDKNRIFFHSSRQRAAKSTLSIFEESREEEETEELEVEADGNVTLRALELERLLQNLTDQLEEKKKSKASQIIEARTNFEEINEIRLKTRDLVRAQTLLPAMKHLTVDDVTHLNKQVQELSMKAREMDAEASKLRQTFSSSAFSFGSTVDSTDLQRMSSGGTSSGDLEVASFSSNPLGEIPKLERNSSSSPNQKGGQTPRGGASQTPRGGGAVDPAPPAEEKSEMSKVMEMAMFWRSPTPENK